MGWGFLFVLLSVSINSWAQVSACITYDVDNIAAEDLRVSHFIKCMRRGDTLYLDGGIDENLIYEIHTFNEQEIKHIQLNSGGGKVVDAFELADYIRNHGIDTHVREGALCASACTLLFQAGVKRTAHESSRFMYHGARHLMISSKDRKTYKNCLAQPNEGCLVEIQQRYDHLMETTLELFSRYEEFGASENLRLEYFQKQDDPDWLDKGNFIRIEDWWLTPAELLEYNVVTQLLSSSI